MCVTPVFSSCWVAFSTSSMAVLRRLSGLGSKFGAFYDSTLDRISEISVFIGILSLYND